MISVVTRVERGWMMRACLVNREKNCAQRIPEKYPRIFTMMMLEAVNSMLLSHFRQIRRAMIIVSIVRRSSSMTPVSLHVRATTACSSANI